MQHRDQVLALLKKQIKNDNEVKEIKETAEAVVGKWINPLDGGNLLRKYKIDLAAKLKAKHVGTINRLKAAYDDLSTTHKGLKDHSFDEIVAAIEFLSPGITVKLVNGDTDEDVAVRSPYNLFVGGNKLGRGVTIKNLLVSYYGRNPRSPQADTVLQHARMYGYRRKDIGLLRLFLPRVLLNVFRAINKMERGLRDLIAENPGEEFRGLYVEGGLNPTRRNVLAPGAIGMYSGGSIYNPAQVMRDTSVNSFTAKLDAKLASIKDKCYVELPIEEIKELIALTKPDETVVGNVPLGVDQQPAREAHDAFTRRAPGAGRKPTHRRGGDVRADDGEVAGFEFPNVRAAHAVGTDSAVGARIRTKPSFEHGLNVPIGTYKVKSFFCSL